MTNNSIRAQAPEESASMGIPAIRIQALKIAIRFPQAVMDDWVYRAMAVTIQNFNL
jgi:hypothetical protein